MYKENFGQTIATLRKEKNMTQLQLADQMNVTDKAVSKWERELSYPDINTVPKLAEVLEVGVEELIQIEGNDYKEENIEEESGIRKDFNTAISIIFKAIPLAMGIAVIVLSILEGLSISSGFIMLGIGMFFLALDKPREKKD
ncbi:MAG: helix-turn-helix transcriptional regulator [Clostridiaceae bacterium]|nr:helix-turn-helix transcriptional regulator [Clostridiaceae bacterium]